MADYVEEPGWRERIAADVRELFGRLTGEVREDARALAPVDTGHLRESVDSEINGDTARIGSDLNYALYVEEGHRVAFRNAAGETEFTGEVVSPQPFLRPALYRKRGP
ncbi:HK97 gp10 family phage protein [Amycolatopsis sp. H20-H5]|uniref:HK97 gp10 family phage protein n=1 Tax=Amycolatopsis sp. H20-H5 TaxID=3046309 RepID=UPI002DB68973|nr:HK97 gp10 family phage protein [Amycolatopsis sp. H20-H5]MEC3974739.1 HK97 gp10 family phage protein [Amycolatopsis sp. H20-H5]